MKYFQVYDSTSIHINQVVEIEDEKVEDQEGDELKDTVADEFYQQNKFSLCAQCSGWGRDFSASEDYNLEVDYESIEETDGPRRRRDF